MLARFRTLAGSLTRAVYLSARNDAIANVAIVAAGLATVLTASHWPDLIVGAGIFLMNLDAAFEVVEEARKERRGAVSPPVP
jgi:Co/Zn/Cd efflux system component